MIKMVPISEAAKRAGISYGTIRRLIEAGKVKARRRGFGKTAPIFVSEAEVERLKRRYALV